MSLIVYPTTGYNSWISSDGAEDYFWDRLGSDAWWPRSQTEREAALITAFRQLKELNLDLTDLRNEIEFEQPDGVITTPKAELLDALQRGQCEQALHILSHGLEAGLIGKVSLGGLVSVDVDQPTPSDYSDRARAILHRYIQLRTVAKVR